MPDIIYYYKTGLIGGTVGCLDSIDGADLKDEDPATVMTAEKIYFYAYDSDSGLAESSPDIIKPDTNAVDGRWILQNTLSGDVLRKGLLQLATAVESISGIDTAKAVTPAGLTSRLGSPGEIGGVTPGKASFTELNFTSLGGVEYVEGDVEMTGYLTFTDSTGSYKIAVEKL